MRSYDYVQSLIPQHRIDEMKETLRIIETGSVKPDYDSITIYNDGVGKTRQITYGSMQTTEQGNLKQLIQMYIANGGIYTNIFSTYVAKIGVTPLCNDQTFINALKLAGKNDPIMGHTQDIFFDNVYFLPACNFFCVNGFKCALSLLIIFDSFVHSGGILDFLRNKFAEKTPVNSGDEKKWISAYTTVRNNWLVNNSSVLLRDSSYRTKCYLQLIGSGDWDLSQPYVIQGVRES